MEKISVKHIELLKVREIALEFEVDGSRISTFGSGGIVKTLVIPKTIDELKQVIDTLMGVEYHLLGFSSNSLISDEGVDCIVTTRQVKGFTINGEYLTAAVGESMHHLATLTAKKGLTGLEFLVGVPATVGGAVAMNAGAFGQEMKDCLSSVRVYRNGLEQTLTPMDLKMAYRTTMLNGGVVLEAVFKLKKSTVAGCLEKIQSNLEYRRRTQPIEKSLGSVFKRVSGKSAAVYIQQANLKGLNIGGAEVSEKHCNFIINKGNASSTDYLQLLEKVRSTVYEKYNVRLETEIKYIKD